MGAYISTEDVSPFANWAKKEDEEQRAILDAQNIQAEQVDEDIATFLGTDIVSAAFIRIIIKIYEDKYRQKIEHDTIEQFNKITADYEGKLLEAKDHVNSLQQYMNELETKKNEIEKEHKILFHTVKPQKMMLNSEVGELDDDIKNKTRSYNNIHNDLAYSEQSDDYAMSSNSDLFNGQRKNERYSGLPDINRRTKTAMDIDKNNKGNSTNTSLNTNQIERDPDIESYEGEERGQTSLSESQHYAYRTKNIKYYAGTLIGTTRCKQHEIAPRINNKKNLVGYHINDMGTIMINGNYYAYLGFCTIGQRNEFVNNDEIMTEIGKFRNLTELDKDIKDITMVISNIPGNMSDDELIDTFNNNELGTMKKMNNARIDRYTGNKSILCTITTTKSYFEWENIWSVYVEKY